MRITRVKTIPALPMTIGKSRASKGFLKESATIPAKKKNRSAIRENSSRQ
jgi:hypothetical protein